MKHALILPQSSFDCKLFETRLKQVDNIAGEMNKLAILGENQFFRKLATVTTGGKDVNMYGLTEGDEVPAFNHAVHAKDNIYLDMRPLTNKEGRIKNIPDALDLINRSALERLWADNNDAFGLYKKVAVDVFSTWASNTLSKRMGLDMAQEVHVKAIFGIYYYGITFKDARTYSEDELQMRVTKQLAQSMAIPVDMLTEAIIILKGEEVEGSDASLFYLLATSDNGYYDSKGNFVEGNSKVKDHSDAIDKLVQALNASPVIDNFEWDYRAISSTLANAGPIALNKSEVGAILIESPCTLIHYLGILHARGGYQNKTALGVVVNSAMRRHNFQTLGKFLNALHDASIKNYLM